MQCQINLLSKGLYELADFRAAAILLLYIFHKHILNQICSFKVFVIQHFVMQFYPSFSFICLLFYVCIRILVALEVAK